MQYSSKATAVAVLTFAASLAGCANDGMTTSNPTYGSSTGSRSDAPVSIAPESSTVLHSQRNSFDSHRRDMCDAMSIGPTRNYCVSLIDQPVARPR